MSKKLMLIDANNIGYAAQHSKEQSVDIGGDTMQVQAIIGVLNKVRSLIADFKFYEVVMVFDGRAQFRYDLLSESKLGEYKGTRDSTPEKIAVRKAYRRQVRTIRSVLLHMGVDCITHPLAEADDVVAWLCKYHPADHILLVSNDEDWRQLVDHRTSILVSSKSRTFDLKAIEELYGYSGQSIALAKAMSGDSSDNIRPIGGFGKTYAQQFIEQYGSVANFMAKMNDQPDAVIKKLVKREQNLFYNAEYIDKGGCTMGHMDRLKLNMKMIDLNYEHNIDWSQLKYERATLNKLSTTAALSVVEHSAALMRMGTWFGPFRQHYDRHHNNRIKTAA